MQACLTSDTFDPTDDLVKARLKLLTKQQTQVASSSLMSDLKEIILQYILATKFHISLANAVVINSRECRGSLAYANTYYTRSIYRRELGKQTQEGTS